MTRATGRGSDRGGERFQVRDSGGNDFQRLYAASIFPPVIAGDNKASKLLVVTDLDGSLLDDEYRWDDARETVARLAQCRFPLVLNSSKTVAELVELARELATDAPLIAENGGVLAVPSGSALSRDGCGEQRVDGYALLEVGPGRSRILETAHRLRNDRGFAFEGFADWTVDEIARRTGLSRNAAERASRRQATEPILWQDSKARFAEFIEALNPSGIRILRGGRFVHLMGPADKADGLRRVTEMYRDAFPDIDWRTVALGDSENDRAMLAAADIAVVIPGKHGRSMQPAVPGAMVARWPGPRGWNSAMSEILEHYL